MTLVEEEMLCWGLDEVYGREMMGVPSSSTGDGDAGAG